MFGFITDVISAKITTLLLLHRKYHFDFLIVHFLIIILNSVKKCDSGLQDELLSNIVVSGGNTMFPGMVERLQNELGQLTPPGVTTNVIAPRDRDKLAWIGGQYVT